jgi:hypothetical protein
MSKIEITKVNDSIAIRKRNKDGVTFTPWTYHSVKNIRSIVPDFALNYGVVQADNNRFNDYPYLNKLRIIFNFVSENGTTEFFDIQDVLNQPSWTADQAGFDTAMADINAWLGTVGAPPTPGIFTPIAVEQSSLTFPYTLPANTYRAVSLVIASGETIELDGVTLGEGVYSFSGDPGDTCASITLDNPSGTGFVLLLIQ